MFFTFQIDITTNAHKIALRQLPITSYHYPMGISNEAASFIRIDLVFIKYSSKRIL